MASKLSLCMSLHIIHIPLHGISCEFLLAATHAPYRTLSLRLLIAFCHLTFELLYINQNVLLWHFRNYTKWTRITACFTAWYMWPVQWALGKKTTGVVNSGLWLIYCRCIYSIVVIFTIIYYNLMKMEWYNEMLLYVEFLCSWATATVFFSCRSSYSFRTSSEAFVDSVACAAFNLSIQSQTWIEETIFLSLLSGMYTYFGVGLHCNEYNRPAYACLFACLLARAHRHTQTHTNADRQ